jgi:hypothetical protein
MLYKCIKDVVMSITGKIRFVTGNKYSIKDTGNMGSTSRFETRNDNGNRHTMGKKFLDLHFEEYDDNGLDITII